MQDPESWVDWPHSKIRILSVWHLYFAGKILVKSVFSLTKFRQHAQYIHAHRRLTLSLVPRRNAHARKNYVW